MDGVMSQRMKLNTTSHHKAEHIFIWVGEVKVPYSIIRNYGRYGVKWLLWIFGEKWDHMYSLKGCKGSNIQGSAQLVDGGPDIQGSVQFGHELKFPSWKIKKKKKKELQRYTCVE